MTPLVPWEFYFSAHAYCSLFSVCCDLNEKTLVFNNVSLDHSGGPVEQLTLPSLESCC